MKVDFVDPFVKAAFTVFEMVTGGTPSKGELSLRHSTFTSQQITIIAGVNGQIQGTVLYGMPNRTAQRIASTMMGSELNELDDMALSAVSELGNMITGNAATILSQNGYDVDITPPSVVRGTNVEVLTMVAALVVPISTSAGDVEINVALEENAVSKAKAA